MLNHNIFYYIKIYYFILFLSYYIILFYFIIYINYYYI